MIKMVFVYDVMMEGLSDLYHILLANYHISFENDMLGAWHVTIVWEYPGLKVFECHGSTQSRNCKDLIFIKV